MRYIHIDEVKPGMILAKTLYDENNGTILLKAEIQIKTLYIKRMKQKGYEYICVKEAKDLSGAAPLDPVCEETRVKGLKIVKNTMSRLARTTENVDNAEIRQMIVDIINEILSDNRVGCDLVQIRNLNNYLFMHSVNVGIIALLIGSALGLGRNNLEMLGAGALLHDVGNILIEPRIVNKTGKLSREEYEMVKNHTKTGFDILKTRVNLSFLSAHVAYQHHERQDGSGYPRGLKNSQIHLFAKITAIADTYDALTSPRSFRKALPVTAALEEILKNTPHKFDPQIVNKMVQFIRPKNSVSN